MINTDKTLLLHYNVDSQGNNMTVKIDNENKQVSPVHYCVQLQQVPDEAYRMVVVDDKSNELIEVFNMDEIKENNYYINYTSSIVYFHPSKAGKTFIFNYHGLGIELIGASRIYDESSINGKFIIRTIQEIIDKGRECIDALSTIGDAVKLLRRIENYIIVATELDIKLREDISIATPLQESLHQDILDANEFRIQLNKDVQEGKTLQPILQKTVDDAHEINTILNDSNANAQTSINLIRSAGNPHFDILKADWVTNTDSSVNATYMKDIVHNLVTENIQISCKDIDSKMSLFDNSKTINDNTTRFFTDNLINMKVVLSARYYDGGSDIGDEVKFARKGKTSLKAKIDEIETNINDKQPKQEIIDARKGEVSLKSKIDKMDTNINDKQAKNDNALTTTNKTIVGAINENKTELLKKTNITNEHIDLVNDKYATIGNLNVANFSGQNLGMSAPIGNVIHHYTDGICTQIDNVGTNTILVLKNANNPGRRPDKPSDFIGNGDFIECLEHVIGGGISKRVFKVSKDGNMYWMDKTTPVTMYNYKVDDGTPCFQIEAGKKHNQLVKVVNNTLTELLIQHNLTNNYVEILSGNNALGMQIQSAIGDVVINPATSKMYVNGIIYMYENGNYGRLVMASSGSTALRPAPTYVGQQYYDTQLGKPIWCHQLTPTVIWHDATGATV